MTRDREMYTREGIIERIRGIRMMRHILLDEELRLLLLKEASDFYNGAPVDALGRVWTKPVANQRKRSRSRFSPMLAQGIYPRHVMEAVDSGYPVLLPGYREANRIEIQEGLRSSP